MISQRDRILPPYTRRVRDFRYLATRTAVVAIVLLFSMFMGFWLAVFGTLVIQPFLAVLGLLLIGALWIVGDTGVDLRPLTTRLFMIFMALLAVWPSYLALDLPGLPWITPVRMALILLMLVLLLQMSQSAEARAELSGSILAVRPALVCYGVFWLFALGTFVLSPNPAESFVYYFQPLILWNMIFLAAAWVFVDKNVLPRVIRILMWGLVFVFCLTIMEYINRKPIWIDHIPAFLTIDGPLLEGIMGDKSRAGDGSYRAQGIFGVHLYFAQYILMILPFIIHAALTEAAKRRAAAIALILFALVVCWMTNTRTALLGFAVVAGGSVALFGLRRFLNPTSSADMVAPAMFLAAPAGILALAGLVVASPRLQKMMFGGAQHAGSDAGRSTQWDRAIEAFLKNPIGYGGGNAPQIAGKPLDGTYVIDSIWISFLVDTGIVGALGFAGFAVWTMVYGVRIYLRNVDESADLCGPAAVAVGSCMMTMYVISYFGNFMLLLVMVGAIAATRSRLLRAGLLEQAPVGAKPVAALARS